MEQRILLFCAALTALGLTAFGVVNWNESKTSQSAAIANEEVAINKPIIGQVPMKTATDFVYDVGPSHLVKSRSTPYLAFVPAKQAAYEGGKDALMEYLKENSKEARASMQMDELPPFELVFTVTKKGTIENAKLDGSSGYLSIDNTMIVLITKAPGKWEPAENSKGEKVDQELVVLFGLRGC